MMITKEELVAALTKTYTDYRDFPEAHSGFGEPSEDAVALANHIFNIVQQAKDEQ